MYSKDREELNNILIGNGGEDILDYGDRILQLIPELIICSHCDHEHRAHKYNVYYHILHVVRGVDKDLVVKLAALLHDIGKPYVKKKVKDKVTFIGHQKVSEELGSLVLQRLGYDEKAIRNVSLLIRLHDTKVKGTIEAINDCINIMGQENFERLLILQTSDIEAHSEQYAELIMPRLNRTKEAYNLYKNFQYEKTNDIR